MNDDTQIVHHLWWLKELLNKDPRGLPEELCNLCLGISNQIKEELLNPSHYEKE